MQAIDQDLAGVESALANDLLRTATGPITARPRIEDCSVVMFTQAWRCGELGFERSPESQTVESETVVVTGPGGDACVYAATRLLYHVAHPNRRFFLDVAAQCMRGKNDSSHYEGRDAEDEEAFDYEVAGALARVRGALHLMHGTDASRVAQMLRDCVDEVEAAGHLLEQNGALLA
jgi:hypothetical protein